MLTLRGYSHLRQHGTVQMPTYGNNGRRILRGLRNGDCHMIFHLTLEERQRFAEWLDNDANTSEGLANEMESIHIIPQLVSRYRDEAKAARIIAAKLRSIQ